MNETENPIVFFENVSKVYDGPDEPLVLFTSLNWQLARGRSCSIVGESGTGKSTLLHLASALDRPTGGRILIDGKEVGSLKEKELAGFRAGTIGVIFQFHFLLKEFNAWENVYLPAWLTGGDKKAAQERAASLLKAVGLESRRRHFPSQLSGGERQRVAVARALINDPPLLLADEPTGNLDEKNSRAVQELLLRLVDDQKKTLLLVTHDLEFARGTSEAYRLASGTLEPL